MNLQTICSAGELPCAGMTRKVTAADKTFCIINVNGSLCVIDDACTHDRCTSLSEGTLDGERILCPRHGWAFDLKTGEVPHLPHKGVCVYRVFIEDGEVKIQL